MVNKRSTRASLAIAAAATAAADLAPAEEQPGDALITGDAAPETEVADDEQQEAADHAGDEAGQAEDEADEQAGDPAPEPQPDPDAEPEPQPEPAEEQPGETIEDLATGGFIPMVHPDGGTCDQFDTNEDGAFMVPLDSIQTMRSHGFEPFRKQEA